MLQVSDTYLVTFPPSVERSLDTFSWVNLELEGLGLPLACAGLRSFEAKLMFLTLLPLGVLLATKVASWFRREHEQEREVRGHTRRRVQVALTQSTYKFLPVALDITFVAFPTVSSLAFKAFRCVDLDSSDGLPGPAVMSADLSITCWGADGVTTPEYARVCLLAALAIVVYPVCVPAGYIVLFWKVRHAMWSGQPTRLSRSVMVLAEGWAACCPIPAPANPPLAL